MRVLITGGTGFAGRHLAKHLSECGDDVAVTYRPGSEDRPESNNSPNSDTFEAASEIQLPKTAQSLALDISNRESVEQIIQLLKPDAVYHLAAMTFVPDAEKKVKEVFDVNAWGTLNLLEAVEKHSPESRILAVSSSEVYGEPRPGSLPITEASELRPISTYGVSKSTADLLSGKFSFRNSLHVVRARPFPHLGPGQSSRFAISSFARQLAMIKLKKAEPVIMVGNLEAKRDYSDVSDIVRGYREGLLNGKKGDAYNFCSGQSIEIGELLQRLIKVSELDVEVREDPERLRPVDIMDLYGSHEKASRDFGWKPRINLDGTLHSLFAFWVECLERAK